MFVQIEGMTPGEYQNGGKNLHVHYSLAETLFGNILIASTEKGICHISFAEEKPEPPEANIIKRFPAATLEQKTDLHQQLDACVRPDSTLVDYVAVEKAGDGGFELLLKVIQINSAAPVDVRQQHVAALAPGQ